MPWGPMMYTPANAIAPSVVASAGLGAIVPTRPQSETAVRPTRRTLLMFPPFVRGTRQKGRYGTAATTWHPRSGEFRVVRAAGQPVAGGVLGVLDSGMLGVVVGAGVVGARQRSSREKCLSRASVVTSGHRSTPSVPSPSTSAVHALARRWYSSGSSSRLPVGHQMTLTLDCSRGACPPLAWAALAA